jgi:hypothetical protein
MADQEGQVSFESTGSLSSAARLTSSYEPNTIARFSAQGLVEGTSPSSLPNLSGDVPDLEQDDANKQAVVARDTSLNLNYLSFSAAGGSEEGDFYSTAGSYPFPPEITILVYLRFRLDREAPGPRALHRVGTLLGLGNRDLQVFYDLEAEETDIQTRLPGGSARFSTDEGSDADFRLYGLVFGAPYDEALVGETIVQPTSFVEPPQDASGTFPLSLGRDPDGRGYLDADVAEIQIFEGRASRFELLDIVSRFNAEIFPTVSFSGSGTLTSPAPVSEVAAEVSFQGLGSINAKGSVDPGDLDGALAWHNGEDERFATLEKCDRVATWYDSTGNTRDFGMEAFSLCQPFYDPAFYNGGGALKFPKEGRGVVSCIFSGLARQPYTIYILGRGARGSGFRCYFRIGNAIGVGLRQNSSNSSLDDLIITTNPGHVSSRQAVYEAVVPRGEFFELLIQGQDGGLEWTLDVSVDRVLLVPTSVEINEEPDPIDITDPCDEHTVLTVENPFSNPYTKTFELEKDGYIFIGEGDCPAYAQIAWYDRVLDADDLAFLYQWIDGRYPAP